MNDVSTSNTYFLIRKLIKEAETSYFLPHTFILGS